MAASVPCDWVKGALDEEDPASGLFSFPPHLHMSGRSVTARFGRDNTALCTKRVGWRETGQGVQAARRRCGWEGGVHANWGWVGEGGAAPEEEGRGRAMLLASHNIPPGSTGQGMWQAASCTQRKNPLCKETP